MNQKHLTRLIDHLEKRAQEPKLKTRTSHRKLMADYKHPFDPCGCIAYENAAMQGNFKPENVDEDDFYLDHLENDLDWHVTDFSLIVNYSYWKDVWKERYLVTQTISEELQVMADYLKTFKEGN